MLERPKWPGILVINAPLFFTSHSKSEWAHLLQISISYRCNKYHKILLSFCKAHFSFIYSHWRQKMGRFIIFLEKKNVNFVSNKKNTCCMKVSSWVRLYVCLYPSPSKRLLLVMVWKALMESELSEPNCGGTRKIAFLVLKVLKIER